MKDTRKFWVMTALMAIFALTRWPGVMPPNFSAAYGLIFCAGAFVAQMPWWLPIGTLLLTDVGLNVFYYDTTPFSDYMAINYLAYAAIFFLGRRFTSKSSPVKLLGGGLLGAVFFYLITNTAAWMQNPEYSKTFAGWIQALTVGTAGWPETWKFFRNTLLGGGLFTGVFAGILSSLASEPTEKEEPAEEPETAPEPEESKASLRALQAISPRPDR